MHIQSNPNEVLLGAFMTGDLNLDISVAYLSQEYGKKDNYFFSTALLTQPVILKIDPSMTNGEIGIKVSYVLYAGFSPKLIAQGLLWGSVL